MREARPKEARVREARSERGEEVKLMNPHIQELGEDVLYHLALGSGSHDLEKMFGDIKFVCMGGTPQRMKTFAGKDLLRCDEA